MAAPVTIVDPNGHANSSTGSLPALNFGCRNVAVRKVT